MSQSSMHVPSYHSRLIGRAIETEAIGSLLRDPAVRLVTILGDSGAGKTRLALEVAVIAGRDFSDGVVFVALAPVDNPCFVLPTIAAALDVKEQGDKDPLVTLQQALRAKRMLLVLDNVEQVSAAGPDIAALLAAASGLTVLATSQVALNLGAEEIFALPPLPVPPDDGITPAEAIEYPSVALFADRMRVVQRRFALTPHNIAAVLEICRRLQGFPLAIELVAAHSSWLNPEDLLILLRNHLAMLPYHTREKLSSRDEILGPVLNWCYSQLPPEVQLVFRRAGVFHGGCTAETMHALCGDAALSLESVERALHILATKQLIQKETMPGNEVRYLMLDALRSYTEGLLKRRYQWRSVADDHASLYLRLASIASGALEGPDQALWLKRFDSEIHNLRAALKWFEAGQNWPAMAALLCDLDLYWQMRGLNSEVRLWAAAMLDHADALELAMQARVFTLVGIAAIRRGAFDEAYAGLQDSFDRYTILGDQQAQARILIRFGSTAIQQGQFLQGLRYLDEAARYAPVIDDDPALNLTLLNNRGTAELQLGRYAAASRTYGRVADICRAAGNLTRLSSVLVNTSVIDYYLGDYGAARECCEEVLRIQDGLGNELHIAASCTNLSAALIEEGQYQRARQAADRALAICARLDEPVGSGELHALLARIERLEGRLEDAVEHCERSVAILQTIDEKRYLATSLREYGLVALERRDWQRGLDLLRESLGLLLGERVVGECSATLEALAGIALGMGDTGLAVWLCGAANANRIRLGSPLPPSDRQRYDAILARAANALGGAVFDDYWRHGNRISLEVAGRFLLQQPALGNDPLRARPWLSLNASRLGVEAII